MGYAFSSTLGDDEIFTTIELKLNFLKPVPIPQIHCNSFKKSDEYEIIKRVFYELRYPLWQ